MNTPIRVLQVFTIMDMGGSETMIMNYYRNIDRSKVQFDFLVHREKKGAYEDEIVALGGRIYRLPPLYDVFAHIKGIRQFLKEHTEYKIIHGHVSILGYFLYREAKKAGVPVIIAHAHNNSCDLSWRWPLWMLLRYMIRPHFTHAMTCGKEAAIWTFGKNKAQQAIQLNNAVDARKYSFHPETRGEIRHEMGWENHYIIGNIARFSLQKNHAGLLAIFQEVLKHKPNALLVLVGDKIGLYEEIRKKAIELGIIHAIQFLGSRTDVPRLLQGMDVFCLPSHYEGFGIVLLEAQAAGLPSVKSNGIPDDAVVVPQLVQTCSLDSPLSTWAKKLITNAERKNTYSEIKAAGFDIHANAEWLQNYYLEHHHI